MGKPVLLREEKPEMAAIVAHLEAHGARGPAGYRIAQPEMAAALTMDVRKLRSYLAVLEKLRLIEVRRTTIDGGFGSPRGFNIYKLKCSSEQWAQLAPQLAAEKRERTARVTSAKARNREAEKRRRNGGSALDLLPKPPAPGQLSPAEVEVLATRYDDDDELAGW